MKDVEYRMSKVVNSSHGGFVILQNKYAKKETLARTNIDDMKNDTKHTFSGFYKKHVAWLGGFFL
jgi:hypothetical protein